MKPAFENQLSLSSNSVVGISGNRCTSASLARAMQRSSSVSPMWATFRAGTFSGIPRCCSALTSHNRAGIGFSSLYVFLRGKNTTAMNTDEHSAISRKQKSSSCKLIVVHSPNKPSCWGGLVFGGEYGTHKIPKSTVVKSRGRFGLF